MTMSLAHLHRAIQDQRTGKLVKSATVTLCNVSTETPISQTIFSDDILTQPLPNPFVCTGGIIDVYLADARSVLLKIAYGNSVTKINHLGIHPRPEDILLAPNPWKILNDPGTGLVLTGIDTESAEWLAPAGGGGSSTDDVIMGWFLSQALQFTSITRDVNGAMTTATVAWPDGVSGIYTADLVSSVFPGKVDSWHVTREEGGETATYTQPEVTRDDDGNVIEMPVVVVT